MQDITFKLIAKAWKRLMDDPDYRESVQTEVPGLVNPTSLHIKNVRETDRDIHMRFIGFDSAVDDIRHVPAIKRLILNWLKQISVSVQVIDSMPGEFNLNVSKETRFTEAAVPVFRRDPKTNKVKRVYKCIGGSKDGRKVADPEQCLQFPDVAKKINLSVTKRGKYGQIAKARTKTKLTNIVSKRVRKANQRLKKARGF